MSPLEFYRAIPRERLLDTLRSYSTPCYLHFEPIIARQVAYMRDALGDKFEIHFAVKANPHPEVLRALQRHGVGADVASARELLAALDAGIEPRHIEFSGPGKTEAELTQAIDAGIAAINVESLQELKLLVELAAARQRRPSVGLRVNPALPTRSGLRMTGATQFGIVPEDLDGAFEILQRAATTVNFVGLHVHAGSQILEVHSAVQVFQAALELARRIHERYGRSVTKVNFGGGWGVTYFDGQQHLDVAAVGAEVRNLLRQSSHAATVAGAKLIVEPGRYLVAESGVYATRILYRKQAEGRQFAIVDGGMHQNYLLAGGMGQVIRRNFFLDFLADPQRGANGAPTVLNVAGCLCTPADILAQGAACGFDPRPGDYVVFFNCGAYGASASPVDFLSHPFPQVALLS